MLTPTISASVFRFVTPVPRTSSFEGRSNVDPKPAALRESVRFVRLVHASGDEGGTGVIRRHDAVGGTRNPRGDPVEAWHALGGRTHHRAEADPPPRAQAQRGGEQ